MLKVYPKCIQVIKTSTQYESCLIDLTLNSAHLHVILVLKFNLKIKHLPSLLPPCLPSLLPLFPFQSRFPSRVDCTIGKIFFHVADEGWGRQGETFPDFFTCNFALNLLLGITSCLFKKKTQQQQKPQNVVYTNFMLMAIKELELMGHQTTPSNILRLLFPLFALFLHVPSSENTCDLSLINVCWGAGAKQSPSKWKWSSRSVVVEQY